MNAAALKARLTQLDHDYVHQPFVIAFHGGVRFAVKGIRRLETAESMEPDAEWQMDVELWRGGVVRTLYFSPSAVSVLYEAGPDAYDEF